MKNYIWILLIFIYSIGFSATDSDSTNYFDIGINYYQQEKYLMAVSSFKKAIRIGNEEPQTYYYLANAQVGLGDYGDALESYEIAYDSAFDFDFQSYVLYNQAMTYYLLDNFSNSITYFDRAYELNPELSQVYWLKGIAYFKLENKPKVITEWENYLTLAPDGEQSENISNALIILRQDDFSFDSEESAKIAKNTTSSDSSSSDSSGTNTNSTDGETEDGESTEKTRNYVTGDELINIEGVLEQTEPSDKGKVSDTEMEDIEM